MGSVLVVLLGVALGLPAFLWWRQESLIFPAPPGPSATPHAPGRTVLPVRIAVAPGIDLAGWLARPSAAQDARLPLILYFGGNAEDVSWMAEASARFPGWALLAVNYRGYAGNPGKPSEAALVADAEAIHAWAAARADVESSRMVAMGRSLGSGVAVQLAALRPLAGVVLVTPFDSLRAVAERLYRFIPVGLLLRHPFDSAVRAGGIDVPMAAIVAGRDTLIPPDHAQRLYERWRGPKQWTLIEHADHGDIDAHDAYWRAIGDFLSARLGRPR